MQVGDRADVKVVQDYAEHEPSFGGVYFDGDVLVGLFTSDLESHRERILPLLVAPGLFRLESATQTYAELDAARERVTAVLLRPQPFPGVTGVGMRLGGPGGSVVTVGVHPYSSTLADKVTGLVAPDSVEVREGGQWILYDQTSPP
jgi:hypothetical protein